MAEETISVGDGRPGGSIQGRTLGPYQIEHQLGRGGMAVVYRAKHVTLERTVALKVLLPSLSGDTDFVNRFIEEARAAARLDNPHIVPIYDSGEIGGVYYIAMKILDGKELKSLLEERREAGTPGLPLEQAISIGSQIAVALDYAHKNRLVHRDVKPANIFVDSYNRVTLTDFGIAKALDRSSSTVTGTVIGTPTYMSPEQAQGKQADFRSDIYSLGVVLYEMLTGAPPFSGNPQTVMYAHVFTPPPPVENIKADLPQGIGEVVQRALAKEPEDRYQSAGALALALSNAASGQLAADALRTSSRSAYYTQAPQAADSQVGSVTGPRTVVPGAPTTGTVGVQPSPVGGFAPYPYTETKKRAAPLGTLLGLGAAAVAIAAAVLLWLFLAGPLAGGGDAKLVVNSDPQGATVTVDGNKFGVTPVGAQKLAAGTHEIVLDKPTYQPVTRKEKLSAGKTDTINQSLKALPAADLIDISRAAVSTDVVKNPDGSIGIGQEVTQVHPEQQFTMVVDMVHKGAAGRDLTFKWHVSLFDQNGTLVFAGNPSTSTFKREADHLVVSQDLAFHANADGSVPTGKYTVKFFIDDQEKASKPIELLK